MRSVWKTGSAPGRIASGIELRLRLVRKRH
jgi:hypothetical protein